MQYYDTLADKCRVNVKYSRSCPRLKHRYVKRIIKKVEETNAGNFSSYLRGV